MDRFSDFFYDPNSSPEEMPFRKKDLCEKKVKPERPCTFLKKKQKKNSRNRKALLHVQYVMFGCLLVVCNRGSRKGANMVVYNTVPTMSQAKCDIFIRCEN